MNKRKIDLNGLKKSIARRTQSRVINVNYDTILHYFKRKDINSHALFLVTFTPLISDLLEQLAAVEITVRLETDNLEQLQPLPISEPDLKLDSFDLAKLSRERPLQQILDCMYLRKEKPGKPMLSVKTNKFMTFYKLLRSIYSDFCSSGEKCVVDEYEIKSLYEQFKVNWSKFQEKGRMSITSRLQNKLCRSIYFLGVIIENNIFADVSFRLEQKKQQNAEIGTRSQKKRNIKGFKQTPSTTLSQGSMEIMSIRSIALNSQKTNEPKNPNDFSEKSEKIVSRSRYNIWDRAEIRDLRAIITPRCTTPLPFQHSQQPKQPKKIINLLSNDVEDIMIVKAFKLFDEGLLGPSYQSNYQPMQSMGQFNGPRPIMYSEVYSDKNSTMYYPIEALRGCSNNIDEKQLSSLRRSYDLVEFKGGKKSKNNRKIN